jgi:sulfite reductase (ferredoxin)
LPLVRVPSKRIPEVIDRVTDRYVRERTANESFQDFLKRVGKKDLRAMLEDLTQIPPYEVDPSFYSDWGDPREYTIGDMGVGECAGEVISVAQFALAAADGLVFQAQLHLEAGDFPSADQNAYRAMLQAALSLVRAQWPEAPDEADSTIQEFRQRFFETNIWGDRYAGNKFAQYLFIRHASPPSNHSGDHAHRLWKKLNSLWMPSTGVTRFSPSVARGDGTFTLRSQAFRNRSCSHAGKELRSDFPFVDSEASRREASTHRCP